jgi:two-component system cell cycle sensor histidine kinase/response regulator CckA
MENSLRVLLVEDSANDAALIVRHLGQGGYDVAFECVATPADVNKALEQPWDLVICDYSMPHYSGTEALKMIRARGLETPFIFVSGTIGEETAVSALKLGAQDYVMKGNLKRLLPAIQRELLDAQAKRKREQLELRVTQLERFEAIGRLAGGIAHDFNNVTAAILGLAHLGYEEASPSDKARERFQKIQDHARHAAALTAQLLAFARRQVLQPRYLSLNELISDTSDLLRTAIGTSLEFKVILAPDAHVISADPTQIEQILMNLCLNARDAMPNGGRLILETKNVEIGEAFCRIHSYGIPGSYVSLQVSDTGIGMDQATLKRIFEPFFTTKELGRGTGLGLATVYGLVKQHEGFINVYSEQGRGTTFHLYFPARSGTAEKRVQPSTDPPPRGTETILLADDHHGLREIAKEILSSSGYTVIVARNGHEAVSLFEKNKEDIQLVILDVAMPVLAGPEAYDQMLLLKAALPVIFVTGYTADSASLNARIGAGAVFLQKPYGLLELTRIVRSTLDNKSFNERLRAETPSGSA